MECVLCKVGETRSGKITVSLDNDDDIDIVVEELDVEICENCGGVYLKFESVMVILSKLKESTGTPD